MTGLSQAARPWDGVSRLADLLGQRLRAGQSENVIDAVSFTPRHRLGARIMAVAPKGEARPGPALSNAPDDSAQMGANFHARWRLAGPQDDSHRTAVFGVVNMDRQEAALIVMGVEQRQLLMAVHNIASVVDVQNNRRRLVRIRRHPLIDQRVGEADRILQRRPVLQPRQRRLRTQVRAAIRQVRPQASLNAGSLRKRSRSSA